MHPSAMTNGHHFFRVYADGFSGREEVKVVDIGALDINGSLSQAVPKEFKYVGVDFDPGNGVDVVIDDPYNFPFEDNSIDIVVSSSCFEHSELFWMTFLDIMRILKPEGLFYLNAPSNGIFHRHPVDCWRFFPDSGRALLNWAERNGLQPALLESWIAPQEAGYVWNDFVAVYLKDRSFAERFPNRICQSVSGLANVLIHGNDNVLNFNEMTQDIQIMRNLNQRLRESRQELDRAQEASGTK